MPSYVLIISISKNRRIYANPLLRSGDWLYFVDHKVKTDKNIKLA